MLRILYFFIFDTVDLKKKKKTSANNIELCVQKEKLTQGHISTWFIQAIFKSHLTFS